MRFGLKLTLLCVIWVKSLKLEALIWAGSGVKYKSKEKNIFNLPCFWQSQHLIRYRRQEVLARRRFFSWNGEFLRQWSRDLLHCKEAPLSRMNNGASPALNWRPHPTLLHLQTPPDPSHLKDSLGNIKRETGQLHHKEVWLTSLGPVKS